MKTKTFILLASVAIFSSICGILAYQWLYGNAKQNTPNLDEQNQTNISKNSTAPITVFSIKNGDKPIRPLFSLKDFDDKVRTITEWDGKIILLNFWASWCPPCKKEMPAFVELQEKYKQQGLQIIGVAIDQKNLAQDFADSIGVNYIMLYGELDAVEINRLYGNFRGQLPYTVIINRKSQLVAVKRGEITKSEAENAIKILLNKP